MPRYLVFDLDWWYIRTPWRLIEEEMECVMSQIQRETPEIRPSVIESKHRTANSFLLYIIQLKYGTFFLTFLSSAAAAAAAAFWRSGKGVKQRIEIR